MIVSEVMVEKLITIKKTDSLKRAQELMVENSIRHLPVVKGKDLLGIITESDIRGAFMNLKNNSAINPAKMIVEDYMTSEPIVVVPETHIEDAALIIYKNKIGALPVMDNHKLVGILSIMDILGIFVDMMGILNASSRVDVAMGKERKHFEKVSNIIGDEGLKIIGVGMGPHPDDDKKQVYFFRLDLCDTKKLVTKIKKAGFEVMAAID